LPLPLIGLMLILRIIGTKINGNMASDEASHASVNHLASVAANLRLSLYVITVDWS
jgi:hypothetical protein